MGTHISGARRGFGYSEAGNVAVRASFHQCRTEDDGLIVGGYVFGVSAGLAGTTVDYIGYAEDCDTGSIAFGASQGGSVTMDGRMRDCALHDSLGGTGFASGGESVTLNGLFVNCRVEGNDGQAFGYSSAGGVILGKGLELRDCSAVGGLSFGSAALSVSMQGEFSNCRAGNDSFGATASTTGDGVTISATFINCYALDTSFGSAYGVGGGDVDISGSFTNCAAGVRTFGYSRDGDVTIGAMSAIFKDCIANGWCFACTESVTGGTANFGGFAYNCDVYAMMDGYAFGSAMGAGGIGIFSGAATNCFLMASYVFGVGGEEGHCSGLLRGCSVWGSNAFGYGAGSIGDFQGQAFDTLAQGNSCFGSCAGLTAGIPTSGECRGMLERCMAGSYSFGYAHGTDSGGLGRFSARASHLQSSSWSFGAGDGGNPAVPGTGASGQFDGILFLAYAQGQYCFGASQYESAGGGGTFSFAQLHDSYAFQRSFGYTGSVSGGTVTWNCPCRECGGGAYCFGSAENVGSGRVTCEANHERCIASQCSFGYSAGADAECNADFLDCKGAVSCFGSGLTSSECYGDYDRCIAGADSFGGGAGAYLNTSGTFKECWALRNSFGSTGTFRGTAQRCFAYGGSFGRLVVTLGEVTLEDCTVEYIDTTAPAPLLPAGSLVRKCRFVSSDALAPVLELGGNDTRLYDSEFISDGGASVDAAVATTMIMAHCRMNTSMGVNVSNSVGAGMNVIDAAIA